MLSAMDFQSLGPRFTFLLVSLCIFGPMKVESLFTREYRSTTNPWCCGHLLRMFAGYPKLVNVNETPAVTDYIDHGCCMDFESVVSVYLRETLELLTIPRPSLHVCIFIAFDL